jgi:hypothetical protein
MMTGVLLVDGPAAGGDCILELTGQEHAAEDFKPAHAKRVSIKQARPWHAALRVFLLAATYLAISGCTQLGPGLVKAGRNEYNIAIQQTESEETLLNIVRLRYGDRPLYMDVGSVSTQFRWSQGVSATAAARRLPGADEAGIGGNLEYSERPTLTYTPIGGADFVRGVLTPVDMDTFVLLANAGWSIERLLRLAVDRMNDVDNAPNASGPTPRTPAGHEDFRRAARLMRHLQKRGALEIGYRRWEKEVIPTLYIEREALDWEQTEELYDILGFAKGRNVFTLHTRANRPYPDALGIDLRSLMEMAFFLSHGVAVPEPDQAMGRVTITRDATGEPFDWSLVIGGLLHIRSQQERPTNAQTTVRYRGSWFFIDDSDMDSKYTLLLMEQLSSLLGGKVEKTGPVLTLPLGGP